MCLVTLPYVLRFSRLKDANDLSMTQRGDCVLLLNEKKRKNDKALKREVQNKAENTLTLFTLVSCVSRHTLAAKGAPLAMTATAVATGRIAHVDTAAVGGQTAWRAGLGVSWGAQIIKLNGGDRGQEMEE